MSQEELAHRLGYKDRSMITKIESGIVDISQSKISQFAEALSTTPAYLMGWSEESEQTFSEKLNSDEHFVLDNYRSLSSRGKEYVKEQIAIASHVYGEKPASSEKIG